MLTDYPVTVTEMKESIDTLPAMGLRSRLERQKANLEKQIKETSELLAILDENPKLERFADLLRRF